MADPKTSKRFKAAKAASEAVEFNEVFKWLGDKAEEHTATTVVTEAMESMIRDSKGKTGRKNAPLAKAEAYKPRNAELKRRADEVRVNKPRLMTKGRIAKAVSDEINSELKSADLTDEERQFLKSCLIPIDRMKRLI